MVNRAIHLGVSWGQDAATTAWVNAVVAAGGAVSNTQKARVDALIVGLKADSLFTKGVLWLHAGESDAKQATIDILDLSVATLVSTPPLSASGYTGNGSSRYVNYGALPSDYVRDDASCGAYNLLDSTSQDSNSLLGITDASCFSDILPLQSGSGALMRMNGDGGSPMNAANANRKGMFIQSRRGANDAEIYYNGTSAATNANASFAITGFSGGFYGLARNISGVADSFSSDVLGAAWIGSGLTDAQAANLSSRINTYMTAWGINVY